MELTYHRKGDYLFPNLTVQDEPMSIGKYGMLRRTYLKENRKNWYQSMLMSGRLNQHLAQIEEAAESRVETLLDSLNKRVDWLGQVCAQLGLEGIRAIHARAEEQALIKGFRDSFDFATARAVADLRLLCELCLPYVKVGGLFLAMKSTDSAQELEDAAHCIKLLGGRVEEPFDYAIPGAGVTHRVIPIRKAAPTLKGYPRRWAKIQKAPL